MSSMSSMSSVILVTGASSGLGRAATERLARAGHVVWAGMRGVSGRNAAAAGELQALALAEDLRLRVVELDVVSDTSVDAAVAHVLAADGRIDVLLNNAGRMFVGLVESFSADQLLEQLNTNLVGSFRVTKAVLPSMRASRSGLLLHVSSVFGRIGSPLYGIYQASKWGMEGLYSTLAAEVHLLGIDSVIVEPGPFRTNVAAGGVTPADHHLVGEYGAAGAVANGWAAGFAGFMAQPIPDLDPSVFADAVLALVQAAPGARPARQVVGLSFGVDQLNALAAPFERGMLEAQQLGFLMAPRDAS